MKTKTKLKRENRKRLKTKTKKLKTKTKMPKQQKLSFNESASIVIQRLRVLRPYGVKSVTNGGRYLGRSSTHLGQQARENWNETKTKK